jgi:hypothetical protein
VGAAGQEQDYAAMLRLHQEADSHEEKERVARCCLPLVSWL